MIMKKRMIVTAAAALTMLSLAAGCGGSEIGENKAKEIALQDAGVSESDISRYRFSKDRDDGMTTYEIQFHSGTTEYEYELNAKNGDILSYDTENTETGSGKSQIQSGTDTTGGTDASQAQNNTQNSTADTAQNNTQNNTQGNTQSNTPTSNVQISEADAKAAALKRVPGATERDLRMELDLDDGKYIYEGDIIYQQTEYEFEIDANTGNFLKWSEERA